MRARRIGQVDHRAEIREKSFLLDNSLEAFSALARFLGSSSEMDSLRGSKRCIWLGIGRSGHAVIGQKRRREMKLWSGRRGSNPRHPAWEADVLPLNYSRSAPKVYRTRQRLLIACRCPRPHESSPIYLSSSPPPSPFPVQ